MRRIEIKANVIWVAERSADCDRWVLSCPPLGISVEANSKEEFSGLIDEAMDLLFVDLLEDNELDRFLADRQWTKTESVAAEEDSGVEFFVPWELVMKGSHGPERRAH